MEVLHTMEVSFPFPFDYVNTADTDYSILLGSCQVGVSYDMMKTNVILASYIGGCPLDPTYDFLVPPLPSSPKAIFSWQWWNRSGNREM